MYFSVANKIYSKIIQRMALMVIFYEYKGLRPVKLTFFFNNFGEIPKNKLGVTGLNQAQFRRLSQSVL